MFSYFKKYQNDVDFYNEHIADRIPKRIVDAHAHFNLPEHVKNVSEAAVRGDWALECGLQMSYEDARYYTGAMLPGVDVSYVCLPWPIAEADTHGNNRYIAELIRDKGQRGLYTLRPEYAVDDIRKAFLAGGYSGFKPYPYFASTVKGAEVSIFDFMTREQFALADELKTAVLMHLPRAGRLPDPNNIAEIREIITRYPNVRLVIAHFGRCFNIEFFEEALAALGEDVNALYFDCAAVINPRVYELAFGKLDYRRILFGTDIPIMLWHGKREWKDRQYINLCREDFSWNKHRHPEDEASYVFVVYEQINNLLNVIGDNEAIKQAVFYDNSFEIYK